MSRTRRSFSAKFKSELVIELLKGEKDLNTIAAENNIQPNLLRNRKKEFLDKASVVFDDTRENGVDFVCFCGFNNAVYHGTGLCTIVGFHENKVLTTDGERAV